MDSTFAEDNLPEGQPPIKTSNVKRLNAFMTLLTDEENRYSTIGVVTAPAGAGKTIAAQVGQVLLEGRFHTVLPACIKVKVMPRSTPRAFASNILHTLGEKSKGNNIYEIAEHAATAIQRNDLRLIIVDEGDRLNEDSFEVVRYLIDKTGCPILIVGLPNILHVIDRHEKFASRVGLRMSFKPLEMQEILHLVLPGLVFPRWSFDPQNEEDCRMGEEIWWKVCPSFRKLRNLLDVAEKLAKGKKAPVITLPIIQEAFEWIASQEDQQHAKKRTQAKTTAKKGPHENASEQRHEGQARKKSDEH